MAFNPLRQLRENIEAIRTALTYRSGDELSPKAIVISLAGEQAYHKATEKENVMAENTGYRRAKGVRI